MKNTITDIFFDLDHTIYDFEKNSELSFNAIFKDLGLEGTEDFMVKFKPINDHYWSRLTKGEITPEFLRIARLEDTFKAINYDYSTVDLHYIASEFLNRLPDFNHVFEGAYETLDYLKDKYRLHIITNGPDKVQTLKLKNSNLEHYFITVTNSEKAGVKKPNSAIFQHALGLADVSVSQSLMIGDNLEADILGGLNVGMQVIWYNEFRLPNELNVPEVYNLKQLITIL